MPSGSQVLDAVCLREGLITEMSACFGESYAERTVIIQTRELISEIRNAR